MKKRGKKQALQPVDRAYYRRWQALYLAFYSSRLYVDVAKHWRGLNLSYVFLLMACVTFPLSLRLVIGINQYVNEQLFYPVQALPPLYIHQGEISVNESMPYLIRNKKQDVVGLVDTTGKQTGMNLKAYPDLALVVNRDKLYFRPPPLHLLNSVTFAEEPVATGQLDTEINEVFIGRQWFDSSWAQAMKWIMLCAIYPCLFLFVTSIVITLLFPFAWLGQFMARVMFTFKIDYLVSYRFLTVALTPPAVVCFGLMAANQLIQGSGYVFVALFAVYFSFAILMFKRASKAVVRA